MSTHVRDEIPQPFQTSTVGRDTAVGIATPYGLDGPGMEFRWERDFPHPSRPPLGAHPAYCTMDNGSFPGVKRPGRGVYHPPQSSAEVKERVELHPYSPSGSSWPVLRVNFTFIFTFTKKALPHYLYFSLHVLEHRMKERRVLKRRYAKA